MLEGVLLTGGASSRMGRDKATLEIDGEFLSHRLARVMIQVCEQVTVLGREPIEGYAFLEDSEEYGGPLVALSAFRPSADRVFVASCDLPYLTTDAIAFLNGLEGEVIVPIVNDRRQPLCAIYSSACFEVARQVVVTGSRSMNAWLDHLDFQEIDPTSLGLDDSVFANVNTHEEWQRGRTPCQ